jgi:prepilin-type N-terminal cleavage/methylation domain-containing protein
MMPSQPLPGFTLIELLVVVTIIVVLLALLTPALDSAIAQAELAVCGANLDATGSGAISYAMNNKRLYPFRAGTNEANSGNYYALHISLPFGLHNKGNAFGYDDRPLLRPYMSINALIDPLAESVDLNGSHSDTMVFASYNLWFGWKWIGTERPSRGLVRHGQKMTYETQEPTGGQWVRRSYNVLAGDTLGHWGFGGIWTAHPDADGVWTQQVHQDEPWGGTNPAEQKSTVSLWYAFGPPVPGSFDQNYTFEDGSVRRYDDVHWNVEYEERERFARVPNFHREADVHEGTWQAIPIR